jgi:peptide/nickel transport system substrate-binding protein
MYAVMHTYEREGGMAAVRMGLGLLVVLLALSCAPPSRAPSTAAQADQVRPSVQKRIAVAVRSNPPTLSSIIGGTANGKVPGVAELEALVHAGLVVLDDQGQRRPQLAEALPDTTNGQWRVFPDGRMETVWKIRPNAVWHDGGQLTSDDLAFTLVVVQDKGLSAFRNQNYDLIEAVETPDPSTILVRWKRPFIDADTLFGPTLGMPMPKHILEGPYSQDPATITELPYWNRDFVGAGPFKVREWVDGSHMTMEANAAYALGRPQLDSIQVRFIPDNNTIVANLLAGSVDLTLGRGISTEQGINLKNQWTEGHMDLTYGNAVALYPQFINPTPAILTDARTRRALLSAIDRQQLADALMAGLAPVAESILDPKDALYQQTQKDLVRYPFDLRVTAQLIEAQGYVRGADGMYRDGAGQRLAFEIQSVTSTDINEKSMLAVADNWQQAGIGGEPMPIPVQRQADREYRATRSGFDLAGGGSGRTALARWRSSDAPIGETNYVGSNNTRYMNPEYDALVDRYLTTIPKDENARIVAEIVRHVSENLVVMGLVYDAQASMVNNRLVKVSGNVPTDGTATWNAHAWEVK